MKISEITQLKENIDYYGILLYWRQGCGLLSQEDEKKLLTELKEIVGENFATKESRGFDYHAIKVFADNLGDIRKALKAISAFDLLEDKMLKPTSTISPLTKLEYNMKSDWHRWDENQKMFPGNQKPWQ